MANNISILFPNITGTTNATSCGEIYQNAMDKVGQQYSFGLMFLALLIIVDWIAIRIYNHGWQRLGIAKNDAHIYFKITETSTVIKLFVIFTMISMYMGIFRF